MECLAAALHPSIGSAWHLEHIPANVARQSGPVCPRPKGWCTERGSRYTLRDCDGDRIADHVCETPGIGRARAIRSAKGCRDIAGPCHFCSAGWLAWSCPPGRLITHRDCDGDLIPDSICLSSGPNGVTEGFLSTRGDATLSHSRCGEPFTGKSGTVCKPPRRLGPGFEVAFRTCCSNRSKAGLNYCLSVERVELQLQSLAEPCLAEGFVATTAALIERWRTDWCSPGGRGGHTDYSEPGFDSEGCGFVVRATTTGRPVKGSGIDMIVPGIQRDLWNFPELMQRIANQTLLPDRVIVSMSSTDRDVSRLVQRKIDDCGFPFATKIVSREGRLLTAENRNVAASESNNRLLSFIDMDDLPLPSRLEFAWAAMENYGLKGCVLHGFAWHPRPNIRTPSSWLASTMAGRPSDPTIWEGPRIFDEAVATLDKTRLAEGSVYISGEVMNSMPTCQREAWRAVGGFREQEEFFKLEDSWFTRDVVAQQGRRNATSLFLPPKLHLAQYTPRQQRKKKGQWTPEDLKFC